MFSAAVKIVNEFHRVQKAADKASVRNLQKATFRLYVEERDSIKSAEGPSKPGTPPHTHTAGFTKRGKVKRGWLPRSYAYKVDKAKKESVTGPRYSVIRDVATAFEFGGEFRGANYPERSIAKPALEKILPDFAGSFQNSLGA